jgi:hypothetical protein
MKTSLFIVAVKHDDGVSRKELREALRKEIMRLAAFRVITELSVKNFFKSKEKKNVD